MGVLSPREEMESSSFRIRSFISLAALLVKVIARICLKREERSRS